MFEEVSSGGGEFTFQDWLRIFSRGNQYLQGMEQGSVTEVGRTEQAPWGTVLTVRQPDTRPGSTFVTTATLRIEEPLVVMERVVTNGGVPFESDRITHWEWLDSGQLEADFWMTPPKDVPIGP
jgi:hypothetical protein